MRNALPVRYDPGVQETGGVRHLFRETLIEPSQITVRIDTPAALFEAPDVNPFSTLESDILGEAALVRVAKRLRAPASKHVLSLIIILPVEQITPGLDARIRQAIDRFTTLRIEENDLEAATRRGHGWKGLLLALAGSALLGLIAFAIVTLADLSEAVTRGVVGFVAIVIWVILWTPIETLAFDWIPRAKENAILRRIRSLAIELRPAE